MYSKDKINTPVVIQDLIAYCPFPKGASAVVGEFGNYKVEESNQKTRLYATIKGLIDHAANQHKKANCYLGTNKIKPGMENAITRLVTNEFAFYTKTPLTIAEFEQLQQQIFALAKQQPANLHLALSSFAVRTPDNKVMNIVAHVTCGPDPKVNFVVKNNPSSIDPVYSESKNGKKVRLPNVDVRKHDTVDQYKITLNGKSHYLSFNNVFECKTEGNTIFNTCIDICLDHDYGVAKENMDKKLQGANNNFRPGKDNPLFATQCSHILTSNTIGITPSNTLGTVTHADPSYAGKRGAKVLKVDEIKATTFGTPIRILNTEPKACSHLPPYEMQQALRYNQKVAANDAKMHAVRSPIPPARNPVMLATNKMSTPVVNKPTTPVIVKPTTPVVNKPATPVVNKPATPVVNKPATPVVNKPATPVVNKPATPVMNKLTTPIVNKPLPPAHNLMPAARNPHAPAKAFIPHYGNRYCHNIANNLRHEGLLRMHDAFHAPRPLRVR